MLLKKPLFISLFKYAHILTLLTNIYFILNVQTYLRMSPIIVLYACTLEF